MGLLRSHRCGVVSQRQGKRDPSTQIIGMYLRPLRQLLLAQPQAMVTYYDPLTDLRMHPGYHKDLTGREQGKS
jgi:hypothetical protein